MVADRTVDAGTWDRIGLADRPTFQRPPAPDHLRTTPRPTGGSPSADAAAPYHFGSRSSRPSTTLRGVRELRARCGPLRRTRAGRVHPRLGRSARAYRAIVRIRGSGPRHRPRLGGRLCRQTASVRRTWPAARSRISCSGATPTSSGSLGRPSLTRLGAGAPALGWESTPVFAP